MRRLRVLSIDRLAMGLANDDLGIPRECLAALADAPELKHLRLVGRTIASQDLALLASLRSLKSLTLESVSETPYGESGLLTHLPALPNLDALDLQQSSVFDDDLKYVAALPRLKSLNLNNTVVTGEGLAELAPLGSLEELTIGEDVVSTAGFESLLKLKRLRSLHIRYFDRKFLQSADAARLRFPHLPESERHRCLRALKALQDSKPNLVIDGDVYSLDWPEERMVPSKYETIPERSIGAAARQAVGAWKEQQAGK
jgi:hypothetical protein